jgi:hypothetical protein
MTNVEMRSKDSGLKKTGDGMHRYHDSTFSLVSQEGVGFAGGGPSQGGVVTSNDVLTGDKKNEGDVRQTRELADFVSESSRFQSQLDAGNISAAQGPTEVGGVEKLESWKTESV